MKPEYLTLSDGSSVRVEINMNTLGTFAALTGKEIFEVKKTDMNLMKALALCAITEGEACDGKECKLTEIELGRLMGIEQIIEFNKLINKVVLTAQQKKSTEKKKPKPRS